MARDAGWRRSLGAALIVRDEAANLAGCLLSLIGVVDEVHVHDTGSTDGTPELAAALGAVVTHGPWTEDFAAARTAALQGWSCDWVLSVDADEHVAADVPTLRGLLDVTEADALLVEIYNDDHNGGFAHQAGRLFRPATTRWVGRVHEHVVAREGELVGGTAPRELVRLRHSGYQTSTQVHRKGLRNTAVAQAALDQLAAPGGARDHDEVGTALLNLGRSLTAAERTQDAVDTFETLRAVLPGTRYSLMATDYLARLVNAGGLHDVALLLSEELRAAGAQRSYCDWLAAQALVQLGMVEQAWLLLTGIDEVVTDPSGCQHAPVLLERLVDQVGQLRRLGAAAAR